MIRKKYSYPIILAIQMGFPLFAQISGSGIGIIAGNPTGLCYKYWINAKSAICGALGWSLTEEEYIIIRGDYIFHEFDLMNVEKGKLPVYYGIGGCISIKENEKDVISFIIPIGIDYILEDINLDAFLEISPIMDLYPETKFKLSGCIGMRYFF